MTKLEKEIFNECNLREEDANSYPFSVIAAMVALKYIKTAWDAGRLNACLADNKDKSWFFSDSERDKWIKENIGE